MIKSPFADVVDQVLLWLPSQNGGVAVFLQVQSQTVLSSSAVNETGSKSVPLWEPSQNGWLELLPQRHQ